MDINEPDPAVVNDIFISGMYYIQQSIECYAEDFEKSQIYMNKFFDLLKEAHSNLSSALLPKHERSIQCLTEINEELCELKHTLYLYELLSLPSAKKKKVLVSYRKCEQLYGQLIFCYNNNLPPPPLVVQTIQIERPVLHLEVPPGLIFIELSNFAFPNVDKFIINFSNPLQQSSEYSTGILNSGAKFSIYLSGLSDEPLRKKRQPKAKITFEIVQIKKSFFNKGPSPYGTTTFEFSNLEEEPDYSSALQIIDNKGNPISGASLQFSATLFQPLLQPKFEVHSQTIHEISSQIFPQLPSNAKCQSPSKNSTEQNEIENFIYPKFTQKQIEAITCASILAKFIPQVKAIIQKYKDLNRTVPSELQIQVDSMQAKFDEIVEKTSNREISPEQYKESIIEYKNKLNSAINVLKLPKYSNKPGIQEQIFFTKQQIEIIDEELETFDNMEEDNFEEEDNDDENNGA